MDRNVKPSLRDLFSALFRHKTSLVLIPVVSVLAALAYASLTFPVFESDVRILVKLGKEQMSGIATDRQPVYNAIFEQRLQNINNEIEIMKEVALADEEIPRLRQQLAELETSSRASRLWTARLLVRHALERITDVVYAPLHAAGLMQRRTPEAIFIDRLTEAIRFEQVEETDVIRISFRWDNPQFAALVLNEYVHAYQQQRMRVHESGGSHDFYQQQIGTFKELLTVAEGQLSAFLERGSIADLNQQKRLLLDEIAELEQQHVAARLSVDRVRLILDQVDRAIEADAWPDTPSLGEVQAASVDSLAALDQTFFEIQDERETLLQTFQPASRQVRAVDARLASIRDQKGETLRSMLRPRLVAEEHQRNVLEAELAVRRSRLEQLNDATVTLARLERERGTLEQNYLLYRNKAEEMRITDALSAQGITSVRVLDLAEPGRQPISPRKMLVVSLALLFGIFIAFASTIFIELFDQTLKTDEDVRVALGVPVVASVPYTKHPYAGPLAGDPNDLVSQRVS
jgi:uncharacterized protein involved in exopolysaccharide biosynthesis